MWPFALSTLLNLIVWMSLYPRLVFLPEAHEEAAAVAPIRVDQRRRLQPPHRQTSPRAGLRVRLKPASPSIASDKRNARPSRRARVPQGIDASNSLISAPNQVVRLKLPPAWSNLDLGAATAEDSAIWLDFKKARGAFVPRILVMKLKTTYLSGPSLRDAVHDIVDGLRAGGAYVRASYAQTVCGGKHPGWFLAYDKRSDDPPADFDEILMLEGDTVYRITYSRADGAPADAKTRAALRTLCPLHRS